MSKRAVVEEWLQAGLEAVDPETLTASALEGLTGPVEVLAIGKAAPAMCRGLASVTGDVSGVCVTSHADNIPDGIDLMVGDHPIPGKASLAAGQRVLEMRGRFDLALISGGGSALCEFPAPGLDMELLAAVNRAMVEGGASIVATNLVRTHISSVKGGGAGSMPTYVLSDVAGGDPAVVSSGPTIPVPRNPTRALQLIETYGIEITPAIESAVRRDPPQAPTPEVVVVGDGKTAAMAVAETAPGRVVDGWLTGDLAEAVDRFIDEAGPGVSVGAGETYLDARSGGRGGRNTHAALLAARAIAGTEQLFAALATDGVDGKSESAGAIVDGTTIDRGGDPELAIADCDSAPYLHRTGDLVVTGPTGTNVADLWLIWKPDGDTEPILSV